MKLYIFPPSPRAIKVVAVANHLDLELEIHALDYFRAEQHSPDFAAINPNRRMPVLDDDGFVLWEANAILQYLAQKKPEASLWPSAPRQQADVLRWMFWEIAHWEDAWGVFVTERVKKVVLDSRDDGRRTYGRTEAPGTPDPKRLAEAEAYSKELSTLLDNHLKERPWLCGIGPTLADFAIGVSIPIAQWYGSVEKLRGWKEAFPPWQA
jgi:glutathione S-transferase